MSKQSQATNTQQSTTTATTKGLKVSDSTVKSFGPAMAGLMEQAIARAFGTNVPVGKNSSHSYRPETVLLNTRQGVRWVEEEFSSNLNIENIARTLTDAQVLAEVLVMLKNKEAISKTVQDAYSNARLIKFGERTTSAPKIYTAVGSTNVITNNMAKRVIGSFVLHALQPTDTVEPTDSWYTTTVSMATFPTYEDVVQESLKSTLEATLIGLPEQLAAKSVNGKIASDILGERVARALEPLVYRLQDMAENIMAIDDVFLLVRSAAVPGVFTPEEMNEVGKVTPYDKDWVKTPEIKELAANFTVFNIAMSRANHRNIVSMPHKMDTWIKRVYAFFMSNPRYKAVTVADFKERYSKRTIESEIGVPTYVVIAQNAAPKAEAQVVSHVEGSVKSGQTEVVKMYQRESATQDMLGLFGDMPSKLASSNVLELTCDILGDTLGFMPQVKGGVVHMSATEYSLGSRDAVLIDAYDKDAVETALALACFTEVFILPEGEDGTFTVAYEVPVSRSSYTPSSGRSYIDTIFLSDPAEAILLAADWHGTSALGSQVQVLPANVLRMPYVDQRSILFTQLNRDNKMTIGFDGASGGKNTITTSLTKLMGRNEGSENYCGIVPVLLNAQGNNYFNVLAVIDYVATYSPTQPVSQAAEAKLIHEVTDFGKSMMTGVMASLASSLRREIAMSVDSNKRHAVLAQMESALYRNQISITLASMLISRLGVFERESNDVDVFTRVIGKSAFFLKYEVNRG